MLSACCRIMRRNTFRRLTKLSIHIVVHWLLSSLNCDKNILRIDRFYINQCACKIEHNLNGSLDSSHGCIYNDSVQIMLMLINFFTFSPELGAALLAVNLPYWLIGTKCALFSSFWTLNLILHRDEFDRSTVWIQWKRFSYEPRHFSWIIDGLTIFLRIHRAKQLSSN